MGPRTGSPAAEIRSAAFLCIGLTALWVGLYPANPAWGATARTSSTVTVVVVNSALSITEDTGDFSLALESGTAGTESATQQVTYRLRGNSLPASSLEGVISAKINDLPEGIQLQAQVGSFINNGTQGNIELHENQPGFKLVGTQPVPLADKGSTSGAQAKVLNGSLAITWKAQATQDLPATEYPLVLTVTLKDS